MSVAQIRQFYLDSGREMFDKNRLLARFRSKFDDDRLAGLLQAGDREGHHAWQ